ncbi:MAG: amino acid ABC transporter permease [Candidatus Thorarchaeota archaeon]
MQIERYIPELVDGFSMTMGLYFFGLFLGFGLGLVLAIVRHYGGPVTSRISTAYIEFFRGTPLLAQILAVTFFPNALNVWLAAEGLPTLDVSWQIIVPDIFGIPVIILSPRILLCALAIGLNSAAYQAEFFRGAMASLAAGQTLAAQSIGMTKRQEIVHIALPQSLRRAIPAWTNEAVYLPKYTTIAYFVGVAEFFSAAKLVVARTYQALLVYAMIAIIFLILIAFITFVMDRFYARVKIPGI